MLSSIVSLCTKTFETTCGLKQDGSYHWNLLSPLHFTATNGRSVTWQWDTDHVVVLAGRSTGPTRARGWLKAARWAGPTDGLSWRLDYDGQISCPTTWVKSTPMSDPGVVTQTTDHAMVKQRSRIRNNNGSVSNAFKRPCIVYNPVKVAYIYDVV